MIILSIVLGVAMIALILWDAIETIILPRRVSSFFGFTPLFYRLTWPAWSAIARRFRSTSRQNNLLWPFGPLSVLLLLGVWAVGLIIGFGLLRGDAESNQASFWHYLYVSATTFF